MGALVAAGAENNEAASQTYLATTGSGQAIDQGLMMIALGIMVGVLANISGMLENIFATLEDLKEEQR